MAVFIAPLAAKTAEWQQSAMAIAARAGKDPEEIGAAAHDFLMYSGYVALAYWWARSVAAAAASAQPAAFKAAKRDTATCYYARRAEERRGGNEWLSRRRYRWVP